MIYVARKCWCRSNPRNSKNTYFSVLKCKLDAWNIWLCHTLVVTYFPKDACEEGMTLDIINTVRTSSKSVLRIPLEQHPKKTLSFSTQELRHTEFGSENQTNKQTNNVNMVTEQHPKKTLSFSTQELRHTEFGSENQTNKQTNNVNMVTEQHPKKTLSFSTQELRHT